MEKKSTIKLLNEICCKVFNNPNLNVTSETNANDISNWDSLNHVVLIMEVEKTFNVKFALGDLQDLKNIGNLVNLIDIKTKRNIND